MRPTLLALAQQQKMIERLGSIANNQHTELTEQRSHIASLGRGLQALAQEVGVPQTKKVVAAMLRTADVQNPAQPVPEPPAVPPTETTAEAETPEAFADVSAPGMVPGTTQDVAADATTTAYTPGMDIAGPAFKNLVDVTAPIDGTQTPRPLNEVKTLTDVRVGDPMNPQTAFPLQGPFANGQRTSSKKTDDAANRSNRTMASLRLARLQLSASLVEGDDFEIATKIEKSARSTESIQDEIGTLTKVQKAASRRQPPPRLVPRTASVQRTVPSMQGMTATASASSTDVEVQDADLFD